MTTRPGYIWSGTEWVAIGQEAIASPFYYQATAPSTPSTGDIWVESDVDVPSIDSSQLLRWRKTVTGGQTSLSGNDDASLPLSYTPGYEQLYINGVLQVRGVDYTATTGTTITGLTALVANDVVEIFSVVSRAVADVYTQTQSDARFVPKVRPIISGQIGAAMSNPTSGQLVAFDDFWVNQGGISYNSSTRRFTVPTTGVYRITFNPFALSGYANTRVLVGVNTDSPTIINHRGHAYRESATYDTMCIDSIVSLNANDYVCFFIYAGALYNSSADRFNQFSIELVG